MNIKVIEDIIKKIEEYDRIALFRHVFPDPDSYGAQNGLKSIINNTYPEKKVILMGDHSDNLSYIGKMDEAEALDKETLAIILDVSNKERVDNQDFFNCGYVIKIDHHKPFDAPFEDLTWVDTNYPATCEMILDLYLNSNGKLKIDKNGRKSLFTGIIGDTGRFLYVNNPTELLKKLPAITFDLDTSEIYPHMYKRKEEELQFLGYIYSNYKKTANGVAYLKIPKEIVNQYGLETMKAVRMVNALQDTEGVLNWMFYAEKPEGGLFCEFRSSGPRVNDIAAKYGGGGHMLAAGASIDSFETADKMIAEFDENCLEYIKANY